MKADKLAELKALYSKQSKHSNYQILPRQLSKIMQADEIDIRTRFEKQRLKFIIKNIDITGKSILDIGGNTGYFSFELLERGARFVHYYEGNKEHADFVRLAADVLNFKSKMRITNKFFSFQDEFKFRNDVILLLNVLHHLGDDYGPSEISMERAKHEMLAQLNSLAEKTDILVFQMGFNWKGDKALGLFTGGTKCEMVKFINQGTNNYWEIIKLGIAQQGFDGIEYKNIANDNIARDEKLGEFLNRPIFILKSIKKN